jgi:hypothetical protein
MTQCNASGYQSRILCGSTADCPGGIDGGYTCPGTKAGDSTDGLYKTCHPPVADAGTATEGGAPRDAGIE